MKKIRLLSVAVVFGSAILFLYCQKDGTAADPNIAQLNFDAAYVVNGESNSISVINLSTNKVDKTIDLAKLQINSAGDQMGTDMIMKNMWPHHISLSPDKSKLVIAAPRMDLGEGEDIMQESVSTSSRNTSDAHSQHHEGSTTSGTTANSVMPGRILILDALTGELLKELTLEGMAHNAVFSPDGKELWTSLMMEGKVKVFDALTYSLIETIPAGQMSAEVTFSDDGKKVFVANGMSNTVTIIDAATKKVIETIAVEGNPVGVWPGLNGMMNVENEAGQSISMVNSMTNMMTDTVDLGFMPCMVVRNEVMNQIWVSDPEGSKIHMWKKNNDEIHMLEKDFDDYIHAGEVAVGKGAHAIAFNKEGNVGYVTNQTEGTVSVIDIPNLKEIMKITVGRKPNGIVIRNNYVF